MAFIDNKQTSEPSFVFHHIPKTAGTSFMAALHNWFQVYSDYQGLYKDRDEFRMHPVDPDFLSASSLLAGHWNTATTLLDLRYPNLKGNKRFQFLTFLRDPLQMHISLYNYRWKMDPEDCARHERFSSLGKYLLSTRNRMAELLGCTEFNYKETLERFYFIGITEKMEDSIKIFKRKTLNVLESFPNSKMARRQVCIINSKPEIEMKRLNVVERKHDKEKISPYELEIFNGRNCLDYMIYEHARNRLIQETP